jgi:hypothetical protein
MARAPKKPQSRNAKNEAMQSWNTQFPIASGATFGGIKIPPQGNPNAAVDTITLRGIHGEIKNLNMGLALSFEGLSQGIQSLVELQKKSIITDKKEDSKDDKDLARAVAKGKAKDIEEERESRLSKMGGSLKEGAGAVKTQVQKATSGFTISGFLSTLIGGALLAAVFAPEKFDKAVDIFKKGISDLLDSEFYEGIVDDLKKLWKQIGWDSLLVLGIFGPFGLAVYEGFKWLGNKITDWAGFTSDGKLKDEKGMDTWFKDNLSTVLGVGGLAAFLMGPLFFKALGAMLTTTLGAIILIPALTIGVVKIAEALVDQWNKQIDSQADKVVSGLEKATAQMAKTMLGDMASTSAMVGAGLGATIGVIGGIPGIILGSLIGLIIGAAANIFFKTPEELAADNAIKDKFWDEVGNSLANMLKDLALSMIGEIRKSFLRNTPTIFLSDDLKKEKLEIETQDKLDEKEEVYDQARRLKQLNTTHDKTAGGVIEAAELRAKLGTSLEEHQDAEKRAAAELVVARANDQSKEIAAALLKVEAAAAVVAEIKSALGVSAGVQAPSGVQATRIEDTQRNIMGRNVTSLADAIGGARGSNLFPQFWKTGAAADKSTGAGQDGLAMKSYGSNMIDDMDDFDYKGGEPTALPPKPSAKTTIKSGELLKLNTQQLGWESGWNANMGSFANGGDISAGGDTSRMYGGTGDDNLGKWSMQYRGAPKATLSGRGRSLAPKPADQINPSEYGGMAFTEQPGIVQAAINSIASAIASLFSSTATIEKLPVENPTAALVGAASASQASATNVIMMGGGPQTAPAASGSSTINNTSVQSSTNNSLYSMNEEDRAVAVFQTRFGAYG